MAAIDFDTFTSPYSTTLVGTEGFTCTRSSNLQISSLTSGLSGPSSQTGSGLLIWYPQSAGQNFFNPSGGTTYTVGAGSISLFKGRTIGGVQIASFTLNANFAGDGGAFAQNDESAAMSTVTIDGTVSGMTGVAPDSVGAALKIYVGGTLNIRDLPAQLSYESASGNACTTNVTNNTAAATYPTVIVTALQGGASANMALRSNGTYAIKFGNATHGSFRRTTGNASGVETFILGGSSGVLVENEMLYGTTITVGSAAFKKQDASTWILSGNNSAFSSTTLEGGTLRGRHNNAFGGNVTMAVANTVLELANNVTIANTTAVNAIGTIRNVSGDNTMSGGITLAGATTFDVVADSLTLSGLIIGSTALSKTGTGVATLSNTSNSFTGNPSISAGTLAVPAFSALGNGPNLPLTGSGVLRYTGVASAALTKSVTAATSTGGFENYGNGNMIVATGGGVSGSSVIKLGSAFDGTGQFNVFGLTTVADTGFNKQGPGRWIVTDGTNRLGPTTVSGGTIMASNANGANLKLLGGSVTVQADARIQTGSDGGQLGKNRYTSLTVTGGSSTPSRIRIGGSAVSPTMQLNGTLNLPTSGQTIFDLSADVFKTPGTYTLVEFVGSFGIGTGDAAVNIGYTGLTGRTATFSYAAGTPNRINVQIS